VRTEVQLSNGVVLMLWHAKCDLSGIWFPEGQIHDPADPNVLL
jgi:hypothetical protein